MYIFVKFLYLLYLIIKISEYLVRICIVYFREKIKKQLVQKKGSRKKKVFFSGPATSLEKDGLFAKRKRLGVRTFQPSGELLRAILELGGVGG